MRSRSGSFGAIALAVVALAMTCGASSASAAFGVAKWEAGTCKEKSCGYASPESVFFTQVAGRPDFGITDFTFNDKELVPGVELPDGTVKDVRVDLPPGLSVNPQASAQCTEAQVASSACPAAAEVGTVEVTPFSVLGIGAAVPAQVYNVVPKPGEPAEFGFRVNLLGLVDLSVYLEGTVNWAGDYHEGFTIREIPNTVPLFRNRLVFSGTAGNGSFITVGSNCQGTTTSGLTVDSHEAPGSFLHYDTTPVVPFGGVVAPTGCGSVPFAPKVAGNAGTAAVDSPGAATAEAIVPFEPSAAIGQANVKRAEVTLPRGMGLNPASASGLEACTAAQFHKGQVAGGSTLTSPDKIVPPAIQCPPKSKIGTVNIDTPVLPAGSLPGTVYLADQQSRDPLSGKEYRIFVAAESARYGVYVRLNGEVRANPATGQLTAVFDDPEHGGLPQVPFSNFRLTFDGGKGVLTSPPICGAPAAPNTITSAFTPWTGRANANPSANLPVLTSNPGGGACSPTMAGRPFAPGLSASPKDDSALAFTPFTAHLTRPQGQQELKGVDITLPEGATAKLAGVPYCPPAAIAAAATKAGASEKKNATCPDDSHVGTASIQAGTGASPLTIDGDVYLAGPYKGAPLSLVVVTPALAGPFDLGTVVVRVALFLDPETAQIHPIAEIPDVYGGAKLDIRSIAVNINRKEFTLNGTNCRKDATAGVLRGGGADPTNPAAFSAAPVSDAFQGTGCQNLNFKPKLKLRLFGKTKRASNPKLRAELRARPGDANIGRVSVGLPHALFLDQSSLAKVCTRVQFKAQDCPKKSIYGHARAFTPLLGKPLEGPVYLRSSSSSTGLPNLVAHLEGQVDIDLVGRIDSFKGGIRTTFDRVPDVPVEKFVMTLPGGKHGLLESSTNLCAKPVRGIIQIKGQNGKTANKRVKLRTPCKGKKGKRGKHKHRKSA